jgi:putative oxidoreductase
MTTHTMPATYTETRGGLLRRVLATEGDWGATVARVALGAVMLPHGAQKLFGWFGGYGFHGTMGFLTTQAGLPYRIALLVILIESIGALALVLGLAGRVMAAGVAAVMVGAVALALVVMLRGSGAASVDRALSA